MTSTTNTNNTTNYETVGVQDPGTMTTASSPSWTQCQGNATSMAYKSMMDLQTLLVQLQGYWQEMIQDQANAASACAQIAADATEAAANDAAKMLDWQAAAAGAQAGVAAFEGGYGLAQNYNMKSSFEEAQTEQNTLNRLDKNLAEAKAPGDTTKGGQQNPNGSSPLSADANTTERQQELLNGRNSIYDNPNRDANGNSRTAYSKAREKESNSNWKDEKAADKLDEKAISHMDADQREKLSENLREERGNNSRKFNNLNNQKTNNMQVLQLGGTLVNQTITAADKGMESGLQKDQGAQQAIEKLAQSNQQMASQAASDANKNKDSLAQEASKAVDTLSALAQCSRAV